jgi:uncharacterized phosphosugar-binding protein
MPKLEHAGKLFAVAVDTIQRVVQEEAGNLEAAAQLVAKSLASGGVLHIFGAGHSHLFAEDLAYRAGGLVPVNPILDIGYTLMAGPPSRSTRLERLEGYAEALLENYDLRPGEVLIVMSQSGRNPGPVEAALSAKRRGLHVVAVTSLGHSRAVESRHSSGKRLFELADVVIDNHVPMGDAALELAPGRPRVAPLSTIVGAAILQALVAEVAGRLLTMGLEPPIWISSNVPGGDEHNQRLAAQYPSRLRHF